MSFHRIGSPRPVARTARSSRNEPAARIGGRGRPDASGVSTACLPDSGSFTSPRRGATFAAMHECDAAMTTIACARMAATWRQFLHLLEQQQPTAYRRIVASGAPVVPEFHGLRASVQHS